MKTNMGLADRVIRVIVALSIVALYLVGLLSGPLSIVLLIAAGVFLLTSIVSFCPIYAIFGLRTCSMKE